MLKLGGKLKKKTFCCEIALFEQKSLFKKLKPPRNPLLRGQSERANLGDPEHAEGFGGGGDVAVNFENKKCFFEKESWDKKQ